MQVYVCRIMKDLSNELFNDLLSNVSYEKQKRINKFLKKEDAYRSLFADLLLRYALKRQFHLSNEALRFDIDSYGKPYLVFHRDIYFNLTHSGDWVGCVLGREKVGIDIEQIKPIDVSILGNSFSAEENTSLKEKPIHEQLGYFYDLWTLKESFIKAEGKGLSIPLNSFTMQINSEKISVRTNEGEEMYMCRQYELEEDYKLSVCSVRDHFPMHLLQIDPLMLIMEFQIE